MQSNQKIDIWLEKQSYRFRWKSEVKSNENGDKVSSHGDYLRGRIKLPANLNYSRYKLELCLVSSPDSDQNIFVAHPYLLHLTQPDTFLPLSDVNKESWKLTFDIDVQSGVIFQNHNGSTLKLPFDQNAPYITLGTKNAMITIVKPVVRSEKEVTIAEVLEERLIHELKLEKNAKSNAEELAKTYRQSGTELPRCRLKATLYYMGRKFSEGISDMDIIDSGDKNVGNFAVDRLSEPHYFCTRGGWRNLITSKHPFSSQNKKNPAIKPSFVIQEQDGSLISAENYFANEPFHIKFEDISKYECFGKRFEFEIPEQNDHRFLQYLDQMKSKIQLYVTLKRSSSSCKPFADDIVKFTYLIHNDKGGKCICQFFKPNPLESDQQSSSLKTKKTRSRSNSSSRSRLSPAISISRSPSYEQIRSPSQDSTCSSSGIGTGGEISSFPSSRRSSHRSNNRLSISPGALYSPLSYESLMSPPNEMVENRNAFLQSQIHPDQHMPVRSISHPSIWDGIDSAEIPCLENSGAFCNSSIDIPQSMATNSYDQSLITGSIPARSQSQIDSAEISYFGTSGAFCSPSIDILQTNAITMGPSINYVRKRVDSENGNFCTFNNHPRPPMPMASSLDSNQYNYEPNQPLLSYAITKQQSVEQRWLKDAQVNQPFKPNTISTASNLEWRPEPSRPQRSNSESAFDQMETNDELTQIIDKMAMDHTLKSTLDMLDESLNAGLTDAARPPHVEKQIPLVEMFDSNSSRYQPKYKSTNRKRRRTVETAAYNLGFEVGPEKESMDAMIGFLDCQCNSNNCSCNSKDNSSLCNISENGFKQETTERKEECEDTLHLSLEYATIKKKQTLTARLVSLFQKLKKKEEGTSYQMYCLTL